MLDFVLFHHILCLLQNIRMSKRVWFQPHMDFQTCKPNIVSLRLFHHISKKKLIIIKENREYILYIDSNGLLTSVLKKKLIN